MFAILSAFTEISVSLHFLELSKGDSWIWKSKRKEKVQDKKTEEDPYIEVYSKEHELENNELEDKSDDKGDA